MVSVLLLCSDQSSAQQIPTALLTMNSQSLVRSTIDEILKAGIDEIIIVLTLKEVESEIRKYFDSLVRSNMIKLVYSDQSKVLELVNAGLAFIDKKSEAFFISRIQDTQFIAQDYVLFLKHFAQSEQKIIFQRLKNKINYPILLSKLFQLDLLQAPQDCEPNAYLVGRYPEWVSCCEPILSRRMASAERPNFDDIKILLSRVS